MLRITVGKPMDDGLAEDQIAVLETNVDDVSGEIIGYCVDRLLEEGAKDVCIVPMYTKKNRPGQIIKVIADQKDVSHLSKVLIAETGTLGVRVYFCERHIVNREEHSVDLQVDGVLKPIKIKVSKDSNGEIVRLKPEFDDLKTLAKKTGKPLREISESAISKARETSAKTE
jgi:uncharacterized protein (DUF111 family)